LLSVQPLSWSSVRTSNQASFSGTYPSVPTLPLSATGGHEARSAWLPPSFVYVTEGSSGLFLEISSIEASPAQSGGRQAKPQYLPTSRAGVRTKQQPAREALLFDPTF